MITVLAYHDEVYQHRKNGDSGGWGGRTLKDVIWPIFEHQAFDIHDSALPIHNKERNLLLYVWRSSISYKFLCFLAVSCGSRRLTNTDKKRNLLAVYNSHSH